MFFLTFLPTCLDAVAHTTRFQIGVRRLKHRTARVDEARYFEKLAQLLGPFCRRVVANPSWNAFPRLEKMFWSTRLFKPLHLLPREESSLFPFRGNLILKKSCLGPSHEGLDKMGLGRCGRHRPRHSTSSTSAGRCTADEVDQTRLRILPLRGCQRHDDREVSGAIPSHAAEVSRLTMSVKARVDETLRLFSNLPTMKPPLRAKCCGATSRIDVRDGRH